MARANNIDVVVKGDYQDKDIKRVIKDLQKLEASSQGLTGKMQAFGKKMQGFGDSVAKVGGGLTKSVTLPIVGVGAAALTTAASFEKSMNRVSAVSGATGEDFDALRDQAQELGRTTAFTASQAAEGMSFLAMAGFETTDILESMPGVLQLASAGQMDLATAADIASNVLTGYGKSADEMGGVVDVLAKTFTSANTDLTQLGEAMTYAAPVAASAGVQFEEAAAAIGLMGNAGIQGSMAGTSLRNAIGSLLDPSNKAAKTIEKLGLQTKDAEGNLLPLDDIVRQLGDSGASTSDFLTIFGKRAGPAMAALVDQGADALSNLTGELENSGGTAQSIADTQMQGLQGGLTRLKSAFEGLMISIADSGLLDRATVLVEQLTGVIGRLTEKFESLSPSTQDILLKMAAVAAAIGPVLLVVGKLISTVGGVIAVFNPLTLKIALVVAAVAALAAGFMYLWNNSETLRNTVMSVFETIRATVTSVIDRLKEKLDENRDTINGLKVAFQTIAQFIVQKVVPVVATLYGTYLKALIKFLGFVVEGIIEVVSFWVKLIRKIAEVYIAIGEFVVNAHTAFATFVENVKQAFVDGFTEVQTFITGVFESVRDTIISTFKTAVNFVIEGINRLIRAWNGLTFGLPQRTFGIGDASVTIGPFEVGTPDLPTIPALAEGGIVTGPTLALIGEAGPEAVVPLSRGGTTTPIVINVNAGIGTDGAQVGRQIVEQIKRFERTNGPVFASA